MGIIIFYKELSSLVQHISKHNNLIIGGDMNHQIGTDEKDILVTQIAKQKWGISGRLLTWEQDRML